MRRVLELLSRHGKATVGTVMLLTLLAVLLANIGGRAEVSEPTGDVRVTVVYDNYSVKPELGTGDHDWRV